MESARLGTHQSPCPTCPVREQSLCASLIDHSGCDMRGLAGHLRQTYHGARARDIIYRRDEPTEDVIILCLGLACRFDRLSNGKRHIFSFLFSGDPISIFGFFQPSYPFSVQALTDVRYSRVNRADLLAWLHGHPAIFEKVAKLSADAANEWREQTINLGCRTADERVAHLLMRVVEKMSDRQAIHSDQFAFPLRQQDIAEFTGLSIAHVNRVIGEFRKSGMIDIVHNTLTVRDLKRLEAIGRIV